MVHCGELCYAEGIVTASIRVLSSIATHGRHDVEAVSCGYSVCVPRLIPGRGFYAQISSEITSEFPGVTFSLALCQAGPPVLWRGAWVHLGSSPDGSQSASYICTGGEGVEPSCSFLAMLRVSIFPNNAKGKHFEHKADHRTKPKHRSGKIVFAMVKDLKVVFGMGPGSQPIESEDGHAAMWKKNSIFWELPYWEFLDVRYAIDVMHITKNLCVNLLGFLGVYGKSKDTLEALIIRGILPDNIRATITKLCAFMNAISQKIGILGPVYLNNMFPFERYMGVLKKYVHNRACPEASIAKGYGTEKVIEFCVEFIEDLRPIGVSESRHEGILWGKGTFGRKAIMTVDNNLFRKAHFTVLQQSSLVAPYIEEHLALVHARNISKSDAWITRHQIDTFPAWLRQHLMGNEAIN
uniref:Transposon protein, putative, CACTA, En/Spm sub-class n=1 Tax=Oryza sativa subsp. japonica TaxID=39947 RepID=H2KWL5_ORYSJ|nr:transposon protein, putative, CACTA, En/Spm sub-class [Oryza sativa Japonica Group]